MYQVVIDTNMLVAALLSNRGASHRLLMLVGDLRWRIDLSVPLVLEYERTLKRVCMGRGLTGGEIDDGGLLSLRQCDYFPRVLLVCTISGVVAAIAGLNVTVPDAMFRQIAELAAREQVSVGRTVSAAPAGNIWLGPS